MRALSFLLLLLSLTACNPDITSLCGGGYTAHNGAATVKKGQDISGLDANGSINLDQENRPQLNLSLSKNNFAVNKNEAQERATHSVLFSLMTQYDGEEKTLPLNTPIPMTYSYYVKSEGELTLQETKGKGQITLREQIVQSNKMYVATQDIEVLSGEFESLEADAYLTGSFEIEENVLQKICAAK